MIGTEQAPAAPPQPGRMSDVPYAGHAIRRKFRYTGQPDAAPTARSPAKVRPETVRRSLETVLATAAPPQRSLIAAPTARRPAKVRPEQSGATGSARGTARTDIRRHRPGATFHRKLNAVKHL